MRQPFTRREFLGTGALPCAAGALAAFFHSPLGAFGQSPEPAPAPAAEGAAKKKKDKGPPLAAETVKEFVGVAHKDLDAVKSLLAKQPTLINAAWDWGGGDWETALGAAAHMGRPDIAGHLLAHDARLDLFAAAMLGKLDIVKATLAIYPEAIKVPGPHGISLIRHAEAGGETAIVVLEYLKSLGA